MGCGGSKEDVATGNTVTRPRLLLRQGSSVRNSGKTSSASTTGSTSSDDSSKQLDEVNGGLEGIEAPPPTSVAKTEEEARPEALALDANVDAGSSEANTGGDEKYEASEENEKASTKDDDDDDDGESIGTHSVDFKEAISVEEAEEMLDISEEKTNSAKDQIANES